MNTLCSIGAVEREAMGRGAEKVQRDKQSQENKKGPGRGRPNHLGSSCLGAESFPFHSS